MPASETSTGAHDHYRHPTNTLFAAPHYLNQRILARQAAQRRHQHWLSFLERPNPPIPSAPRPQLRKRLPQPEQNSKLPTNDHRIPRIEVLQEKLSTSLK